MPTTIEKLKVDQAGQASKLRAQYIEFARAEAAGRFKSANAERLVELLTAMYLGVSDFERDVVTIRRADELKRQAATLNTATAEHVKARDAMVSHGDHRAEVIRQLDAERFKLDTAVRAASGKVSAAHQAQRELTELMAERADLFGEQPQQTRDLSGAYIADPKGARPSPDLQPRTGPVVALNDQDYAAELARRQAVVAEAIKATGDANMTYARANERGKSCNTNG